MRQMTKEAISNEYIKRLSEVNFQDDTMYQLKEKVS